MDVTNHPSARYSINNWFNTPFGAELLEQEKRRCHKLIPSRYYPSCLQVGLAGENFLNHIETRFRCVIDSESVLDPLGTGNEGIKRAHNDQISHLTMAEAYALPFADRTHDLVVLPHTLDFADNPHEVLRQVTQTLNPEGCVAIIGFNLFSLYGLIKGFNKRSRSAPWNGNYYSVKRVQDWLSLLGFDLVGAGMMSYRPPIQHSIYREKLLFMESAGDRWWPGCGGVYVIVGRKKEMSAHVVSRTERWRRLLPGLAKPVTQNTSQSTLSSVTHRDTDVTSTGVTPTSFMPVSKTKNGRDG